MDILIKIDKMLEAKGASAKDVAKARKPTVGLLRPREVGKQDRIKKERKQERRQVKQKFRQYY